jgi:hypothetical protein
MTHERLERWAPVSGLIFVALLVVGFAIVGEGPDVDDTTADAAAFWRDNDGENIAGAIIGAVATLYLVWFAGTLRSARRGPTDRDDRLATTAFGGFLLLAVGLSTNSAIQLAAADSVGDVPPQVTQTLSVLYVDFFFPIAAGIVVGLVASGVAILRYATFPSWLGWAAIAIGIIFIPLWFVGGPLAAIWVVVISVMMLRGAPRREEPVAPSRMPA